MTYIVTGANGFLGSMLVKKLIDSDKNVIAVSRNCNNIPKDNRVHFISLDLSRISELKEHLYGYKPEVFYHLAWDGVDVNSRADATLQLKNIQWSIDCVRLAKELGCRRFVSVGSVMERETDLAVSSQGNKPGLAYIYGAAKSTAHAITKSIASDIGIEHVWAILTNAYGPGEVSSRFVNTTIRKIINNEPLRFTAATQNYDFVYITDAIEALYNISEKGKPFYEYLIGSSNPKPLKEFIFEMVQELSPDLDLVFGDIPYTGISLPLELLDASNTEKDTGFRAKVTFAEGTKRTMEWLKENIDRIEKN